MDESARVTRSNTEGATAFETVARVHASVFAPAAVVGVLYGGAWLVYAAQGRGGDDFARLLLLICAVVTPLLLAHALMRYRTVRVVLGPEAISVSRGWPHGRPQTILADNVISARVRRSVFGRLFGTGSLELRLRDGEDLMVADLRRPERIADALGRRRP
jgi:hypothetical protein